MDKLHTRTRNNKTNKHIHTTKTPRNTNIHNPRNILHNTHNKPTNNKNTMPKTIHFIILILVLIMIIQLHETTHTRIFEIYECENITRNILSVSAYCTNNEAKLATSNAEIIGYTVTIPLMIIIILLWTKQK